ncbi:MULTISPECIES: helix-turn-helix transcriptional regulator [Rodentibacter]|uniref:helix-turn-helix transcriptional regulator n=1 Tax=Rodentibacter TaxID=1960084 RepID=UPI000986B0B1
MERPRLITIGKVADMTGLSPDTIRIYVKRRQFPQGKMIGKRRFWHIDSVNDWLSKFKN